MAPRSRARATSRTKRPQRSRVGKKKRATARAPQRRRSSSMKKSRKRPLNAFFKLMLKAKKNSDESFVYNGNTYKGKKHPKLKMIYKRV